MKKIAFFTLILAVATAFGISQSWKAINPENVKVNFELVGEGTTGTFGGLKTEINFDAADLSKSSIQASIDVNTIDTKDAGRDKHLKNPDFFDTEKFPTITFVSKEIISAEKGFIAKGNLTMKDQTFPIDVPFEFSEDNTGKATLKGKMSVLPYQFGVFKGKKSEKEIVNITVEVALSK